ncbi:unnamed protein product [Alternaria alternata]
MAPKKKETPATGQLVISVAEFRKTRDSVIFNLHELQNGLVNVQHGITSLLESYKQHSDTQSSATKRVRQHPTSDDITTPRRCRFCRLGVFEAPSLEDEEAAEAAAPSDADIVVVGCCRTLFVAED